MYTCSNITIYTEHKSKAASNVYKQFGSHWYSNDNHFCENIKTLFKKKMCPAENRHHKSGLSVMWL